MASRDEARAHPTPPGVAVSPEACAPASRSPPRAATASAPDMAIKGLKKKAETKAKKQTFKFSIDCQAPADDNIIEPKDLEKFLSNKIKVEGKTGNLGEKVARALACGARPPFWDQSLCMVFELVRIQTSTNWWEEGPETRRPDGADPHGKPKRSCRAALQPHEATSGSPKCCLGQLGYRKAYRGGGLEAGVKRQVGLFRNLARSPDSSRFRAFSVGRNHQRGQRALGIPESSSSKRYAGCTGSRRTLCHECCASI